MARQRARAHRVHAQNHREHVAGGRHGASRVVRRGPAPLSTALATRAPGRLVSSRCLLTRRGLPQPVAALLVCQRRPTPWSIANRRSLALPPSIGRMAHLVLSPESRGSIDACRRMRRRPGEVWGGSRALQVKGTLGGTDGKRKRQPRRLRLQSLHTWSDTPGPGDHRRGRVGDGWATASAAMVVRSIADHIPSGGNDKARPRSLPAGVAARADRVVPSLPVNPACASGNRSPYGSRSLGTLDRRPGTCCGCA